MKFTKADFTTYNTIFNQIFQDYCQEKKYGIYFDDSAYAPAYNNYYLGPKTVNPRNNKIHVLNAEDYFLKNEFFNDEGKVVSNVRITDASQKHIKPKEFWDYADKKLDEKGKILFQRIILNNYDGRDFSEIIQSRTDEQNWFFIKHINDNYKSVGGKGEFEMLFSFVKTQKIDTTEKSESFYLLCKYSKGILKRPEFMANVCDYIVANIPLQFHETFEKLLGQKVKIEKSIDSPEDIMQSNNSQTIALFKDKLFQKIKFSSDDVPSMIDLNSFNYSLIRGLTNNCMEQLGIAKIHHSPFVTESNESAITFEFNTNPQKYDMALIYTFLIKNCSLTYNSQTSNGSNDYEKYVKAAVNSYILERDLKEKPSNTTKNKI